MMRHVLKPLRNQSKYIPRIIESVLPLLQRSQFTTSQRLFANGDNPGLNKWVHPDNVVRGEALKKYGRDLTEEAKKGKLDPVIGRDHIIRRVIQVLCRRRKNNPCVIGDAGVGKTAIIEGLALRI